MSKRILGIIPARLSSKRFPGKVLHKFHQLPLLYYVYNDISRSKLIDRLIIATDDKQIAGEAKNFGAEVFITSSKHKTGSDRCGEVVQAVDCDYIINIQADNFGLKANSLDIIISKFIKEKADFGTIAYKIEDEQEMTDPNKVTLVVDKGYHSLWFSRNKLPYLQNFKKNQLHSGFPFLGHIGIYLYTKESLKRYCSWKRGRYEQAESLEQLRIHENDSRLKVYLTKLKPVSVDSKKDLKKLEILYN